MASVISLLRIFLLLFGLFLQVGDHQYFLQMSEIGSGQQILSMKEKPEIECCVNTGVYVMEPEFLELIPEEESIHLPQLIELAMARSQKAGTYIIDESQWMDMGQMEELEQMKHKIEQF